MAVYVACYLMAWMVFGVVALAAVAAADSVGLASRTSVVVTLVMAAAWQLSETKRRSILSCRRTVPLPPMGWRADAACARFAVLQARHCMVVCWPVMLLMAIVGHDFWLMLALTLIVVAEEQATWRDRVFTPVAAMFAAAAVAAALRPISLS
jgi:predicted metal-binding membrane protein